MQLCGDHAADEAGEGVELVQPGAPEAGHLGPGNRDAAEEREDDDDGRVDLRGDEAVWRQGGDHLAQGYREEFGDEDHEELVAGSAGRGLEAGDVVEGEEETDGAEDAIGELGNDHGQGECELAV